MRLQYILIAISSLSFCCLAQIANELKSKSIPVLAEKNNVVEIAQTSLAPGQKMLFVRPVPDYEEFEIIAEGAILDTRNGRTRVKLRMDKLKKIPTNTDYAVMLAAPKVFTPPQVKKPESVMMFEQESVEDLEPGYISLYYLSEMGNMKSTSSNVANSLKQINSLKSSGIGVEWFLEFLPSYGFSFENSSGKVPVFSYFKVEEPTSIENTELKLQMRNQLFKPGWRYRGFLINATSSFTTTNTDAYVISSKSVLNGFGAMLGYDFTPTLSVPSKRWGKPHSFYFGFSYYPDVLVVDGVVSRGSASSGSTQLKMMLGYTHMLNLNFIPYVNRWFFDFKVTQATTNIKMSGKTTSESGSFYVVPEGGTYSETQTLIQISFGTRFSDFLGSGLKSRN
jgi:hypothetical protein